MDGQPPSYNPNTPYQLPFVAMQFKSQVPGSMCEYRVIYEEDGVRRTQVRESEASQFYDCSAQAFIAAYTGWPIALKLVSTATGAV